jgi:hypothetical protein
MTARTNVGFGKNVVPQRSLAQQDGDCSGEGGIIDCAEVEGVSLATLRKAEHGGARDPVLTANPNQFWVELEEQVYTGAIGRQGETKLASGIGRESSVVIDGI